MCVPRFEYLPCDAKYVGVLSPHGCKWNCLKYGAPEKCDAVKIAEKTNIVDLSLIFSILTF